VASLEKFAAFRQLLNCFHQGPLKEEKSSRKISSILSNKKEKYIYCISSLKAPGRFLMDLFYSAGQ